jgi:hypothetical protein
MGVRGRVLVAAVACAGVLAAATACAALAADPGRWSETARHSVPIYYYQGITSDPARNLYFDGVDFGLYRTDSELNELARKDDAIPPQVHLSEGYNHIGDLTWDAGEGGRLLLPLECYYPYPGAPNSGNTCGFGADGQPEHGSGSFGVADPETLEWRYYVKLDERDILKAMWAEVSPDGQLVWTSSGKDLLAYRTSDVKPANAALAGPKLRPVRRLAGAVPPSGITGATFVGDRMLVAGSEGQTFQVWAIDMTTGARELQIERTVVGESEGLDTVDALGGSLHWLIQPYNEQSIPTYGVTNGTILSFLPKAQAPAGLPAPAPCCAPPAGGPPPPPGPLPAAPVAEPPARIRVTVTPRRLRAGRRVHFRVRTRAARGGRLRSVAGARVHFAGRLFRTDGRGRARFAATLRSPGRRAARASHSGLRKGRSWVRVLPAAR